MSRLFVTIAMLVLSSLWIPAAELDVFVSILPQKFIAERVGGDRVSVDVLVRPGQSPHTYSPSPRQMAALARADALFRIGVPFEKSLIPKVQGSVPDLRIYDVREGIALRQMEEEDAHDHGAHDHDAHDHDHDHHHGHDHGEDGADPHIWLSPLNAKQIAKNMADAFSELDSAGAASYRQNYQQLVKELDAVHAQLQESLAPLKGEKILVFHPAFGYFCDAYELTQVAVETGGKEPTARQLAQIIRFARERDIHVIFVQPQFSTRAAGTIAKSIDGAVIPLDPLSEDYLSNLRDIAAKVSKALTK